MDRAIFFEHQATVESNPPYCFTPAAFVLTSRELRRALERPNSHVFLHLFDFLWAGLGPPMYIQKYTEYTQITKYTKYELCNLYK